jgi:DegV family protein with EDD domain
MNNYVIYTDSSCDLKKDLLKSFGVEAESLTFRFVDEDKEYKNDDMEIEAFYNRMKEGGVAKTAAINTQTFSDGFEKILAEGNDVLYIGFSSGLSTTFNSARLAALELKEKYPERKVLVIDSLCASAGLGLLLSIAVDEMEKGKSIDEVYSYIESIKLNICHWFTVDDLVYLKRGGRVSPTVAFVGNMLGIKPILHVDNDGHLINITKVRGRKASILALADKYTELALDKENSRVYISHAFCEADANELSKIIEERHGVKAEVITDVGTVIGAHSGPGTLALFFLGKER